VVEPIEAVGVGKVVKSALSSIVELVGWRLIWRQQRRPSTWLTDRV